MVNRKLILLYVAIAVNIALALLPTYDAVNIRAWVALGSSITSAAPVMADNVWPGGFFSFMAFTPMYLSYVHSGFNIYLSVVVLKLILFAFTVLTAFLLYRITQKVKPAYAYTVLLFTLLNPAILYVNYFWAQIDILPVFFFTLGYALLRFVDFGQNSYKRYFVGFLPIIISAFIYRYALILLPAIVFFYHGTVKQRLSALFIAGGEVAVFFVIEYLLFRGGLYNYVGALSGSVINMSGVQGFQYWLNIPLFPYVAFLCVVGFAVPLLLKQLKYIESAVLYLILLLFIYTSAVPLADYFLWLYPIGVFLALESAVKLSFNKKMLLTGLPIYLALFFISLLIGNGVQTGPFYFAYPLLYLDVPLLAESNQMYYTGVLVFNIFLLAAIVGVSMFCLLKANRVQTDFSAASRKLTRWKKGLSRKTSAGLALLSVILVLSGLGFNAWYSQPVEASSEDVFPLYLFPANSIYDSMPIGQTYYLSWNGLVVYNNGSAPISFNHALNLQNIDFDADFNITADYYGSYDLLRADNYLMGIDLQPKVATFNLTAAEPTDYTGSKPQITDTSIFDNQTTVYSFNPYASVSYRLNQSQTGDYYAAAFQFTNSSLPQSLLFHFSNSEFIFDYTVSNSMQWAFYYDLDAHNSTTNARGYTVAPSDGWNLVVFKNNSTHFNAWVNNNSFSVKGEFFTEDTDLLITSYIQGKAPPQTGGAISELYSCPSMPLTDTSYLFYININDQRRVEEPIRSSTLKLTLQTSPEKSSISVDNHNWPIDQVDSLYFGKLTGGVYGLSVTLNNLELSQRSYGYYLVPLYFAVVVPFAVALLSLLLLLKRWENAAD
jgi:hypothetical protein